MQTYIRAILVLVWSLGFNLPAKAQEKPNSGTVIQQEKAGFTRNTQLPGWIQKLSDIPPTKNKEPLVVRLHETQAWVGDKPTILMHRAIQVNERSALSAIGQLSIEYFPAWQKLVLHRVAIMREQQVIDRTKEVSVRLLQREASMEQGVFGGATSAQFLLDDVRLGDTVSLIYSIGGENPVFGNKWARSFTWDSSYYTEQRKLIVSHPKKRPLYWRQLGDYHKESIESKIESAGEIERFTFEGKAIEAVDFEPSTPSDFLPVRTLQFSEYANWQEVALWANNLFPKTAANVEVSKLAKTFGQHSGDLAKASAALKWVQEQVRYFSLSIGENSHRPASPETVLKRRYGDCKDKSYLLIALLRELGIKASPVLLSAEMKHLASKTQASPGVFDHVIVQISIGSELFYVDPTRTGQIAQIKLLPQAFPGAHVLLVNDTNSSLIQLPPVKHEEIQYERRENIKLLNFKGDATLELRQVYRGDYADYARMRMASFTKSELKKEFLSLFERRYPEIELVTLPTLIEHQDSNAIEIHAKYKVANILSTKEGMIRLEYDAQDITNSLDVPEKIIRNFPFSLASGLFRGRYLLNLTWPESVREFETTSARKLNNPFFHASEEISVLGNQYSLSHNFHGKVSEVTPKEMPALQKQTKELSRFMQGTLQVTEQRTKLKNYSVFNLRELNAIQESQGKVEQARNFKDTPETFPVVCNLTVDALPLSLMAGKIIDRKSHEFDAVLLKEDGKKYDGIDRCRARLNFGMGKYDVSLNLFERQEKFKNSDKGLLLVAWAQFQLGQHQQSAETLDRYYDGLGDDSEAFISAKELVEILALYQRMNKPLPEKWARLAKDRIDGPWPGPLLALQLGLKTQLEMTQFIEQFSTDTQSAYSTDLWFALGHAFLAQGKKTEALDAFDQVEQNGVLTGDAYLLARQELRKLRGYSKTYLEGLEAQYRSNHKLAIEKWRQAIAEGDYLGHYQMGKEYYYGDTGVITQDYKEAFKHFSIAAQAGYPDAENFLALMYESGSGVSKNVDLALDWFDKAEGKSNRHALNNLGQRLELGQILKRDLKAAFDLYRRSALLGGAEAQVNLARFYMHGVGTNQDHRQAFKWAMLSAFQNEPDGAIMLAKLLLNGDGIEHDGQAALALLFPIAHPDKQETIKGEDILKWVNTEGRRRTAAKILMGKILYEGINVPVNHEKARQFFTQASDVGNADGKAWLGMMHMEGKGMEKDADKGMKMIQEASRMGSDLAQTWLARMDAEKGNAKAQRKYALALNFGHGIKVDYSEAAKWYKLAAEQGDMFSVNNLGDLYENGRGVEKDLKKAIALYEKAANNGYHMGFVSLGSLLEHGLGLQKNPRLAWLYYRIAERLDTDLKDTYTSRVVKGLKDEDIKSATSIADSWKVGIKLPEYQ
jgi:TPR repeat protein/transglutaminase-like putative cysteine protease